MQFRCVKCGEMHDGLPALTFREPHYWLTLTDEQRAKGELNSDFCHTPDGHFFIRCTLLVRIIDGLEDHLNYGVWGSLSEDNFVRYNEAFFDEDQAKLGSMFSYLSNDIPDYPDTLNLKCRAHPRNDRQRPLLELEPSDHPLSLDFRRGISWNEALERVHRSLGDGA